MSARGPEPGARSRAGPTRVRQPVHWGPSARPVLGAGGRLQHPVWGGLAFPDAQSPDWRLEGAAVTRSTRMVPTWSHSHGGHGGSQVLCPVHGSQRSAVFSAQKRWKKSQTSEKSKTPVCSSRQTYRGNYTLTTRNCQHHDTVGCLKSIKNSEMMKENPAPIKKKC